MSLGRAETAERAVIAAVFFKPGALDWLDLSEDDFAEYGPRAIFAACKSARQKYEGALDLALVEKELELAGVWKAIGGIEGLEPYATSAATADNIEHYARLVREARLTREMLTACRTLIAEAEGMTGSELLERGQVLFGNVVLPPSNRGTTVAKLRRDEFHAVKHALENPDEPVESNRLLTGIEKLDKATGGLPRGLVTVVAGRPGLGKSTLALQMAESVVRRGGSACIVTYEDPGPSWAVSSLAAQAEVDVTEIAERRVTAAGFGRLANVALAKDDPLENLHLLPGHGLAPERALRAGLSLCGKSPDLVILDYIQNAVRSRRGMKTHEVIGEFMAVAQEVASKSRAAVVVCSQFKRSNEEPTMQDLKEAGSLEECAKLILGLDHARDDKGKIVEGLVRVLLMKNKIRKARKTVTLTFRGEFSRFE